MTDVLEAPILGHATLNDESGEMGYEKNRISQALKAAGVDPEMLNPMDKMALVAALTLDNQLFAEGNFASAMTGLGQFKDQLVLTDEERADLNHEAKRLEEGEEPELRTSSVGKYMQAFALSLRRRLPVPVFEVEPSLFEQALMETAQEMQPQKAMLEALSANQSPEIAKFALQGMGLQSVDPACEKFSSGLGDIAEGCRAQNIIRTRKSPFEGFGLN